jgi:hypothetical protein
MINIDRILQNDGQCKAHTGLNPGGFAYLLELFKVEYDLYSNVRHEERY